MEDLPPLLRQQIQQFGLKAIITDALQSQKFKIPDGEEEYEVKYRRPQPGKQTQLIHTIAQPLNSRVGLTSPLISRVGSRLKKTRDQNLKYQLQQLNSPALPLLASPKSGLASQFELLINIDFAKSRAENKIERPLRYQKSSVDLMPEVNVMTINPQPFSQLKRQQDLIKIRELTMSQNSSRLKLDDSDRKLLFDRDQSTNKIASYIKRQVDENVVKNQISKRRQSYVPIKIMPPPFESQMQINQFSPIMKIAVNPLNINKMGLNEKWRKYLKSDPLQVEIQQIQISNTQIQLQQLRQQQIERQRSPFQNKILQAPYHQKVLEPILTRQMIEIEQNFNNMTAPQLNSGQPVVQKQKKPGSISLLMNKDLHEDGVDGEYGERDFDHNLH